MIVCSGVVVLDRVYRLRELPAGETKNFASSVEDVAGGNAANCARAVQACGGRARLCGRIGNDAAGRMISQVLEKAGVELESLETVDGVATSTSNVCIDKNGGRQIVNHLDRRLFTSRPAPVEVALRDATAVHTDIHWLEAAVGLMDFARQKSLHAVLDYDGDPSANEEALLAAATHCIFAEDTLGKIYPGKSHEQALAVVAKLHPHLRVAVTLGANGILALDSDGSPRRLQAVRVEAVDTLGAGDVFQGVTTKMLGDGAGFFGAMRHGAAAAAVKCTRHPGAPLPRREEVDRMLAGMREWV